jgi:lipopolysaccharide transport system ATP-binding protein
MKRREVSRKLEEIIDFSEVGPHIDTPVKRYSSGMYIRLGFAIAAHLECEIMIADEVLAVGDVGFQQKATGKMNSLSTSQGRTILFVSHNIGAVANLCNKGLILEHGRILLDQCPVEEAVGRYKEMLGIA